MPRGDLSKIRAKVKRRLARQERKRSAVAQAAGPKEEESPSSPSSALQGAATGTPSSPPVSRGVCSTPTAAGSNQVEERPGASRAQRRTTPRRSASPLDDKAALLVHYLLYRYQTKEPITKAEMVKHVIQTFKSHFNDILSIATEHLEMLFGLELKLVDPKRSIYVLINKWVLSCNGRQGRGIPKTGVLVAVLGAIFKKGSCATEEDLWEVLNMMGIYAGKMNLMFGDPRKLITEDFVQQQYLLSRQVPDSDPPRYEFKWGPRAYAETSKMQVLEFFARIHHTTPSAFSACYEEALREEEVRAQVREAARAGVAAITREFAKAGVSGSACTK